MYGISVDHPLLYLPYCVCTYVPPGSVYTVLAIRTCYFLYDRLSRGNVNGRASVHALHLVETSGQVLLCMPVL